MVALREATARHVAQARAWLEQLAGLAQDRMDPVVAASTKLCGINPTYSLLEISRYVTMLSASAGRPLMTSIKF